MVNTELLDVSLYETFQDAARTLAKGSPEALESYLYERGIQRVAGVDEVGRGPIAGPVVACACVLPHRKKFPGLKDSKLLSSAQIEKMYHELVGCPGLEYAVAIVGPEVIDRINILRATLDAMRQAVESLKLSPDIVLVDGKQRPLISTPCVSVVKGDLYCSSISAASVIAKHTRDELMRKYDTSWPQYCFAEHKGYGTALHLSRLKEFGPCPIHRTSFAPLKVTDSSTQLELF